MDPFFNWLKDTGTQAMLVLVGTSAACIAAAGTLYYGRKSLSKKDLIGLETHAAATSGHLEKQNRRDELNAAARRVAIAVEARSFQDEPLEVHLSLQDSSVRLTLIDMLDENRTLYGTSSCVMREPDHYVASLDQRSIQNWFNHGARKGNAAQLWLRVFMTFEEGGEASKDLPVSLLPSRALDARVRPDGASPIWQIFGEV
jgi:hypothetical protein